MLNAPPVTTSMGSADLDMETTMMNSRFWFDMYQRLKAEMARERRAYLDQQAQAALDRD